MITSEQKKRRLRFEMQVVPIESPNQDIADAIRAKFDKMLKELISENLINIHHGASLTTVDTTPIEWYLLSG